MIFTDLWYFDKMVYQLLKSNIFRHVYKVIICLKKLKPMQKMFRMEHFYFYEEKLFIYLQYQLVK